MSTRHSFLTFMSCQIFPASLIARYIKSMEKVDGMTDKRPPYLSIDPEEYGQCQGQDEHRFCLVKLDHSNPMYNAIVRDFKCAGLRVNWVECLENHVLKKRYITERDQLLEERLSQNPYYSLNEKYLYHGTSAKKIQICEEGLDSRLAKKGCFGTGIYFSDYPRKCVKYAEKEGSGESIILLMRVILGDTKVYPKGEKDTDLLREPEKTEPYLGFRYYDSVEGCPVNHKEFVVYERRRALVECIIAYSKLPTDTQKSATPGPSQSRISHPRPAPVMEDTDSDTSSDEEDWIVPRDDDSQDLSSSTNEVEEELSQQPQTTDISADLVAEFSHRTGEAVKHVAETYLIMGDLDVDRAEAMYRQTVEREGEWTEKDHCDVEKLITKQSPIHPHRLKRMAPADREEAVKCLVDNLLESMGMDKSKPRDRQRAEHLLTDSDMNINTALCTYLSLL